MKRKKPTSNGVRDMTVIEYKSFLTTGTPNKKLTTGKKNTSGRNNQGRLTSRFRGGGVKRKFRDIDFMYNKWDIPAKVESVEYDPFRSAFISLVVYRDGERRYVISPKGVKVGDEFVVSPEATEIKPGNRTKLAHIPVGTFVYNVESRPQGGARFARSAGNHIEVVAHDEGKVNLKMPSSEVRKVDENCMATIGQSSNEQHKLVRIGKAGRARKMGRRPSVRGSAMNPVDHPHGGGEGKTSGGRHPVSPTGKPTKGAKTRTNKTTDKYILRRRSKKRRK